MINRLHIFLLSLVVASSLLILIPSPAMAQQPSGCDSLQERFNKYGGNYANVTSHLPKYCTAAELLQKVMNVAFSLIGGVTLVFLGIGGYRYITSKGNDEQATQGKQTILYAALGLATVIMAAAIVNIIINLIIGQDIF